MSMFDFSKKTMSILGTGLFMVIGTYNAVVINSESSISGADVKFVKRLDEIYGVTEYAREAASATHWQKLKPIKVADIKKLHKNNKNEKVVAKTTKTLESTAPVVTAAVQETLDLNLVEVVNQKKWQNGLKNTQFTGALSTNNGVIETLAVSLPNGEGVSVSFADMNGNVFEYDFNGELYSGMMYQVDTNSYMVTLTNGPLEGTRMKFDGAPSLEQQQANEHTVAESEQKDDRVFGNDGSDIAKPAAVEEQVAMAAPAQNVQEAYDRDLQIQQGMQPNEQQMMNGETMQAQEQTPGFYDQFQQQNAEQAQSGPVNGEVAFQG